MSDGFVKMGVTLMAVGLVATALLAYTEQVTREPIAKALLEETLQNLAQVLPKGYDNKPVEDTVLIADGLLNKKLKPVLFYRARSAGAPHSAAFVVTAPDGYSGDVDVMMAVSANGTLNGIQVVLHKETPGLGDKIDAKVTDWPKAFQGKTLDNVKWGVKKDGGAFDQFAGATISPRAVVKAVHKGLQFFVANKDKVFAAASATPAGGAQ